MKTTFLELEQPIAEPEAKIRELRFIQDNSAVDTPEEISRLASEGQQLIKDLYASLTPWQVMQIARHPQRPYTFDYVREIFTDFRELYGDRIFADDLSIVGDLARFNGQTCMVIGHQKGRDTKERALRNFDVPKPKDYCKTKQLIELADKFDPPIFTFVNTSGAFPGIDAEERGQSEAIRHSLLVMASLKMPLTVTIIGEGGSGGALAIAMGDSAITLQFTTYAVILPEGCTLILWKTAEKAPEAAEALGLTAYHLRAPSLIGKIVNKPLGDTHRGPRGMATVSKRVLVESLRQFQGMKTSELQARYCERLMAYSKFKETKGR